MNTAFQGRRGRLAAAVALAMTAAAAQADVVTDWNIKANDIVIESKIGTPPAVRVMALVQAAVDDAVREATARPGSAASVDAAVAAANRAVLIKLLPAQQATTEAAYNAALSAIADGPARTAGIAAGEKAAAAVLARRAADVIAPDTWRPIVTPGVYVPTAGLAATQWPQRKPWLMNSAAQFRPGPPPALTSEAWARDVNEVREFGARNSTSRSTEQTEVARFWDFSLPAIYHGAVRSVADQPGRDVARNARLLAAVAQSMDDALIAVFDAKYQYNLWRPVTAIRNGDLDGNDATPRDAGWVSLIDAPMHPEYPSGHSILAGAIGVVLKADTAGTQPVLSTSSPTAKGATRRWTSIDAFVTEIGESRIYGGIHYRTAIRVANAMGEQIGALAVERVLRKPDAMAQLQPPAEQRLVRIVPAQGVQIYECRVAKAGGHAWAFVAPQAELYDERGRAIGHHGAGPYWEARDGSRIEGAVVSRADAPAGSDIPWLLLDAKSTGVRGQFSRVASVQRLNTVGGIAPALPCTADMAGRRSEVPYSAEYRFYAPR